MIPRELFLVFLYVCVAIAAVPDRVRFSSDHGGKFVVPRNVTPECLAHTSHWMSQLRRGVPWALQMLDSATKLPSGILMGSTNHMGNFDQCIAVSVQDEVANFQGRFCRTLMDVNFPNEIISTDSMKYAICVPSSCTAEDLPDLLQNHIGPALGVNIIVESVNPVHCYLKESSTPLSTSTLILVILAALLAAIVVLCAVVEWRLKGKIPPLVRACSLTSNCRSLFDTRKHPADISCLHGLRVYSFLWIILGHRYEYERLLPISNLNIFDTYFANPLMMTVANAMPSVDTFFFLSGLLMSTSFLRQVKQNQATFDVIKFYIYRYLRLAIPLGVTIALYILVLPLLGSGPVWNELVYYEARNCRANWWINMLFVNNYIQHEGYWMCVGQTWYTAVDMQLAWLSPLVLLPLYHSPRAGLQLMTLLILISCFIPFTITYIFRFPMSLIQIGIDIPMEGVPVGNFEYMMYYPTHTRATPYFFGLLFGYYLFKTKGLKATLTRNIVYAGWTCSTVVALTVIYSLCIPYQPGYVYDIVGSAFYAGFYRVGWSAVLAWIVFACINNYGGVADRILSWKWLLPLSRLTYSAFLLHIILITYDNATSRVVTNYSDYDLVHGFFGHLLPIYLISFLMYILVEGPSLLLLKIAFSKGVQHASKKATNNGKDFTKEMKEPPIENTK